MNKYEILEKSRREGKDEGAEFVEMKTWMHALLVICAVYIIVIIMSSKQGLSYHPASAVAWTAIGFANYSRFKANGNILSLVCTIGSVLFAVTAIVKLAAGLI